MSIVDRNSLNKIINIISENKIITVVG